jgi:hypothetical protein
MGCGTVRQRWSIHVARLACAALLVAFTAGGSCYVSSSSCFCEGSGCNTNCNRCNGCREPGCHCGTRQPLEKQGGPPSLEIRGYELHAAPDGVAREVLRAVDGPAMSSYQVGLAAERHAFVRALLASNPAVFGAGPFEHVRVAASDGGAPWVTLFERPDGELLACVLDAAGRIVEIERPARELPELPLPVGRLR